MACKRSIKTGILQTIKNNDIVIFTLSYCPFCNSTKNTLANVKNFCLDIDKIPGTAIQTQFRDILSEICNGHKTFPKIFIRGVFIGGNSDLQEKIRKKELIFTY